MTFNMSDVPEKDRKVLLYISNEDLSIIQRFVDETIVGEKYVQSKQVYEAVRTELNSLVPRTTFCSSFSLNVRAGRIAGIAGARGKGYHRVGSPTVASHKTTPSPPPPEFEPEANEKPAPEIKVAAPPAPKTPITGAYKTTFSSDRRRREHALCKHTNRVWIERRCYKLFDPRYELLNDLVFKVMSGGSQKEGGPICFEGKQYTVDDLPLFMRIVEHILIGFYEGDSDPVLDDGSGLPLWLQTREPREPVVISATPEEKQAIVGVDEASRHDYNEDEDDDEEDEEEEETFIEADGVEADTADDVVAASCESMHLGNEPVF